MNHRLKWRLWELNSIVERAIDRTDTKRILNANKVKVDPQHKVRVRDREIENAEKQKEAYEKEIAWLEKQIEDMSGVDKLIEKEQMLRATQDESLQL